MSVERVLLVLMASFAVFLGLAYLNVPLPPELFELPGFGVAREWQPYWLRAALLGAVVLTGWCAAEIALLDAEAVTTPDSALLLRGMSMVLASVLAHSYGGPVFAGRGMIFAAAIWFAAAVLVRRRPNTLWMVALGAFAVLLQPMTFALLPLLLSRRLEERLRSAQRRRSLVQVSLLLIGVVVAYWARSRWGVPLAPSGVAPEVLWLELSNYWQPLFGPLTVLFAISWLVTSGPRGSHRRVVLVVLGAYLCVYGSRRYDPTSYEVFIGALCLVFSSAVRRLWGASPTWKTLGLSMASLALYVWFAFEHAATRPVILWQMRTIPHTLQNLLSL